MSYLCCTAGLTGFSTLAPSSSFFGSSFFWTRAGAAGAGAGAGEAGVAAGAGSALAFFASSSVGDGFLTAAFLMS